MNIQDIINSHQREVSTVCLTDKVNETIRFFSHSKCKAAVVVDNQNGLCGIVTEHDLVRCLGERQDKKTDEIIDDIMSLDLVVCTPEMSVKEAIMLMSNHKIHYLPVVSKSGHLVGFVDMMEVMVNFIDNQSAA